MREIKFRAWHSGMRRIISAEELGADQMTILPSTGQFINVSGDFVSRSTIYPLDKFVPMQYTGLKDKNGKEIYEGDVLMYTDACWANPKQATVVWDPDHAKFTLDAEYGWGMIFEDIQVIGNIRENPEMLK